MAVKPGPVRVSLTAWGAPSPKGSYRIVGRGKQSRVIPDNAKTNPWQSAVGWAAKVAMGPAALIRDTPLRVTLTFYLPRPVRPKGDRPMVKPDLDKLVRATLDGMTGVLFDEDSRVVEIVASKFYAVVGQSPGCSIVVESV